MLKKVIEYINEHRMIEQGDQIVVGVSGGADSVCLFHALLELRKVFKHELFVVHVNHGIRGEEANEDEKFVESLCKANGISFTGVKIDVPAVAKLEGLTLEEAGRKVRYDAFYKCFRENKCNKIAIAHNRNDNAETILFHLFRGSGMKGLTGIQPVRGEIIRPLLAVTRTEIEKYLLDNRIPYRHDSTNFTMDYTRNKIRLGVLPLAQEGVNSKAIEHITNAAEQLSEIETFLSKVTNQVYEHVVIKQEERFIIPLEGLNKEDIVIQKKVVRKILHEMAGSLKDLEALHVDLIMELKEKEVGKKLNLPRKVVAIKGYETIELYLENEKNKDDKTIFREQVLNIPGSNILEYENVILNTRIINYKKNMIIPQNGCTKWFDYDKIKNTVLIRTRKSGDYMQINHQGNTKKLKQLFIDEKIPKSTRDRLPLIADGSHIMWILGHRMSEAYKVEDGTKLILEISLDGGIYNV